MASIAQIRGARGLLGWSQTRLALAADLSLPTVKRFETASGANVSEDAISKMASALEVAGVEFTNGGQPGVRLRKPALTIQHGRPARRSLRDGDRVRFRLGRVPDVLNDKPKTTGRITEPPEGQIPPMGGVIHVEFPILGLIWISPGELELVEENGHGPGVRLRKQATLMAEDYIAELIKGGAPGLRAKVRVVIDDHLIRGGFAPHSQSERERVAAALLERLPDSKRAEEIAAYVRAGCPQ
jgi:transcriptional regulator with XRE-family HTH domain